MIVAISDQHGSLPEIPPCDLLLVAGDICPVRASHDPIFQREWLLTNYTRWLESIPAKEIVLIAGNHDFVYEQLPPPALPAHYLQDSGIDLCGYRIWGSPWQPPFWDWAFNLPEEAPDHGPKDACLAEKWALIPDDTDILVTHSPPYHYLDRNYYGEHCGSKTLLARIKELPNLKLHVFGHIHEDGLKRMYWRNGQIANASILSGRYESHGDPLVFKGL